MLSPFPVSERYRVAPEMRRLEGKGHFLVDDEYEGYLEEKLKLLEAQLEPGRRLDPKHDREGLERALWHVLSLLAAEHPDIVELGGGTIRLKRLGLELGEGGLKQVNPSAPLAPLGERAATWLSAQEGVARLADALALSVQEDYVVMSGNAREHRAELLHVLFPSHWNPAERLGQDFAELHRPVAHSRPLLAASERVMRALFHKGPFIRYVWGLEAEGSLSQHPELFQRKRLPDEIAADPDRLVKTLYFRTERQTTLAMPELGRCLFTIRVTLRPLLEVLTNQERKRRLALALYSMDETLLAYKNLTRLREPLLSWLEQGFRRPVQPP